MSRAGWDFDYAPLHVYAGPTQESEFVVATIEDVDAATLVRVLTEVAGTVGVTPLLSLEPLFWFRVELSHAVDPSLIHGKLGACGIGVRYVASARFGSQALGKRADYARGAPRQGRSWPVRHQRQVTDGPTPGRWFLDENGVNVQRNVCGTGAGTRLAVIDNEAGGIESLELDAEILVGVSSPPRGALHGALMVGWAVGARVVTGGGDRSRRFCGVAPDASTRLYCIPKPGQEVYNLPLAIVRAVDDGADVILCSTYVDGQTTPMLDDALEFARRQGRGGKGAAVVMPASREMSSAEGSHHASLSLGLGEPASDPRIFCVGPSSHDGQWFLWRDRRGRLHPFANRGPSLRWLAPGDDMAMPMAETERAAHGESSGAASVAAGVLLLVLGMNPELSVDDLDVLLTREAQPIDSAMQSRLADLADPHDLLPLAVDRDGHNAKHGYGRMDATRACAAARDPLAAAFLSIGEGVLGVALAAASASGEGPAISDRVARWMARELIRDDAFRQGLAAFARSIRLWSAHPRRFAEQPACVLARQLTILLRSYVLSAQREVPVDVVQELREIEAFLESSAEEVQRFERRWITWLTDVKRDAERRARKPARSSEERSGLDSRRASSANAGLGSG